MTTAEYKSRKDALITEMLNLTANINDVTLRLESLQKQLADKETELKQLELDAAQPGGIVDNTIRETDASRGTSAR